MHNHPTPLDWFATRGLGRRSLPATVIVALASLLIGGPAYAQADAGAADDPAPVADEAPAEVAAEPAPPPPPPPNPNADPEIDGPTFPVSAFEIRYLRENPLHPPIEEAMELPLLFGETPTGFVAPRPGPPLVQFTIADVATRKPESYHASAIQYMLEKVRDYYVAQDILGVYVAPDPTQISELGVDLRSPSDATLALIVTTGIVTEMRSVASGERVREGGQIPPDQRIDNTLHTRIIERSPIRPAREGDPLRQDLLLKTELDNYLFHLARHPGRRVDASVAAAQEVGGIALDYIVTENHPFVMYAQLSNTGTRSTDYLRQRFGFFNTQFSFNDDILSLDYTTANFDGLHSLVGSYEAPFPNDRIRWKVYGGYSQYDAQEVGQFSNLFEGESIVGGGEIVANIYQKREFFLDIVGGLRLQNEDVENNTFAPFFVTEGNEFFIFPHVGLRFERNTEWVRTDGELMFEFQWGDLTDTDQAEMNRLGRTLPDRDWTVMKWSFGHSVFLEPLLNRAAWEDPSTPESSTLAHEMNFTFRGQYAFDQRLIPQSEHVVGGLYSVRGYPESVVAGDTAIIASVEYRYHVPRAMSIQPEPRQMFGQAFRMAPQYVYGTPDWDLVLKGFFDYGRSIISNPLLFEAANESLYGAGVGVDFLYRRNINIRVDWGFALDDLRPGQVHSGANRLQFVATFMY
ncbi:MAG: ShlB/FhaC/HecB family hemolysin secretion/activation protein [Planctomycetes bacterium]|nr:ShlB/FhaC/HecB family hemolysin secretion/activation protein [Planctomycetota bacterium]